MVTGGIAGISERADKEEAERAARRGPGNELWLFDGDTAIVSIVASGEPDDLRIQDYQTYRATGMGKNGAYQYDAMAKGTSVEGPYEHIEVSKGTNLRSKFGVWLYVEGVLRNPANRKKLEDTFTKEKVAEWEEETSASGRKTTLKQPVQDFLMWTQGFGRAKYIWNQIVDIYDEDGALNKFSVHISRTGSGRDDTAYSIKSKQGTPAKIPTEVGEKKAAELIYPVDFFLQKEKAIAASIAKRAEESKTTKLEDETPPWDVPETSGSPAPSFDSSPVSDTQNEVKESLF